MRASLLIILIFLGTYTTWVQKTTREVLATTSSVGEELQEKLKLSETARISAEVALAAAKRDLESFRKVTGGNDVGRTDTDEASSCSVTHSRLFGGVDCTLGLP